MKILFVSAEVSPFAKVGGLADVAGSLPAAVAKLGHDVRVIMPDYKLNEANARPATVTPEFRVNINDWWVKKATLRQTTRNGVDILMAGTDEWFNEVDRSERIYAPPVDAYIFFARAVLESCRQMRWMPDVVHVNDWHPALIPVLMREKFSDEFREVAAVQTIHNLAYQGEFEEETLDRAGLPRSIFNHHQTEAYGRLNFLKAGCSYSDLVNTVSPTYAEEIQTPEFGCRLDGLMRHLAEEGRLCGILNGIDTEEFDPATDLRIPANYDAHHIEGKEICRKALENELGLAQVDESPIAGVVSRLSGQKGIDHIIAGADQLVNLGLRVVVQGLGDQWIADKLRDLEKAYPGRFKLIQKFDVEIAQRIYAGSDFFLMPSAFEPCGLGQMIALRYGTIPIVRSTGGLADTIVDGKNGRVFSSLETTDFVEACAKAVEDFKSPNWRSVVASAMQEDFSWDTSALKYEELYLRALSARSADKAKAS